MSDHYDRYNGMEKLLGTDAISRQAVLVAVKDALMAWSYMPEWRDEKILEAIAELPPAEPQIIRCKDCKNWDTTWTNDFSPNYHYCPMVDMVRKEDWFCADAERRTE